MNGTTRTHIDLFSGIGGFALAARWAGVETVAFCEIEKYAQRVLRKNFPGIRILEDVRSFPATEFRQPWLITGGYPCQPFSQAGKRRGTEDDRHLWPEMFRIIRSSRPVWVLCENVAGHITMGLDEVISDLEGEEYSVQSFVIPAQAVDARHRRDRVWIVGNCNRSRLQRTLWKSMERNQHGFTNSSDSETNLPDTKGKRGECWEYRVKGINSQHEERLSRRSNSRDVSYTDDPRFKERRRSESVRSEHHSLECSCKDLADSLCDSQRSAHRRESRTSQRKWEDPNISEGDQVWSNPSDCGGFWLPEPDLGRVAHGIPNRVDRLKGLGNAIVPQVAYQIIRTMIESEEQFIGEQHENQP